MDPRLAAALEAQLDGRRAALAAGARHVGWKLGMGDRERIGDTIAVGHLTSATVLEPGATYVGSGDLHADAEIAVELARDVDPAAGAAEALRAVARYGVALELVDLAPLDGEPDAVVAANVFHRAVAFGPVRPALGRGTEAHVSVDGSLHASGRAPGDLGRRLREAARILDVVGERLRAGDRVITGSIVQVPVGPGDAVVVDAGELGRVGLSIAIRG